jgi:hypothetical protein
MKRINLVSTLLLVAALALAAFPTGSALAATDTVGPITSAVAVLPNPAIVNSSVTVTATVDDSTTGASNIQSAEFNVNGGSYTAMTASDGAFDSATENVTATFTVPQVGDNQVCVHGTDASNNVGADVCVTLTGQSIYKFGGFKPPIRPGVVNMANAGRTVPVKWKLTLTADGSPVSDPTSITAIKSYAVDCTSLTGDSSTAIVEKSPGKSGLRYLNGGNWIFNWKTDKSYSGTCRNLFILFSDGSLSPEVTFQFK